MTLTLFEIEEIYANQPKRGRPMLRDKWGLRVLDVLEKYPDGLAPTDLQHLTGLAQYQICAGAKWLRANHHEGGPIVYVPNDNRWYCATLWPEQFKTSLRSEFLQRASSMVLSGEQLLAQAEVQFPDKKAQIKRLIKDADRLREDAEELVAELR
jgi:hypothetical protein